MVHPTRPMHMLLAHHVVAAALALVAQQAAARSWHSSRPPPASAAIRAGPPARASVQASPLRYTAEGLSTIWFVNADASNPPFNSSVVTSCIITPYRWGTDFAEVPGGTQSEDGKIHPRVGPKFGQLQASK